MNRQFVPFGTDYDGDTEACTLSVEEAIAEAKKLMQLNKNIIHARYGKLTVATDQNEQRTLPPVPQQAPKGWWNPPRARLH